MKTNNEEKKLTTQQYRLYDYLEARGDQWTSRKDIATKLYIKDHEDFKAFKGTNNCPIIRRLTKDIRALRSHPETNKLIISGFNGYKIANNSEVKAWLKRLEIDCRKKWDLYHNSVAKAVRNGQYRLTNGLNQTLCIATTEEV